MRLPRRTLVLLLTLATVPLGAAAAIAAHAGNSGVQQASPFGAPTPPHVRRQQPPRPGLIPAAPARAHGVPGRLSPAQVQALAQAQQPPAGVPAASPTPSATAPPSPTPTGTPTPHPSTPMPTPTPRPTPTGSH